MGAFSIDVVDCDELILNLSFVHFLLTPKNLIWLTPTGDYFDIFEFQMVSNSMLKNIAFLAVTNPFAESI